jgi:hypothetical protein
MAKGPKTSNRLSDEGGLTPAAVGLRLGRLVLAFSVAGFILLTLRSVPKTDGFLLMWRGICFGGPFLIFSLALLLSGRQSNPREFMAGGRRSISAGRGQCSSSDSVSLFLKMVIDVGICYIAWG